MAYYWCEICDHRWEEEYAEECPKCKGKHDFRRTMSPEEAEEARKLGLLDS